MGGDGVVHQVANGLLGGDTSLAIIPAGTTNVLARILGYPPDPRDAAAAVAESSSARRVPVAAVTTDSPAGVRHRLATFAAGVGFDAAVVRRAERTPLSKVAAGGLHYAWSAVRVLLADYRTRLPHLRVSDGRRRADAVAVMVQLHDTFSFFGPVPLRLGGTRTGPVAAVVNDMATLRTLWLLARAARGLDPGRVPGVEVWAGFDTLTIEAEPAVWAEADGELLGKATRVEVAPESAGLLVVHTHRERRRFSLR
jgi:diacylglycerol kinase family enzyme